MHEMGIVQSMLDIIVDQAESYNVKKVVKINLEFGVLTAVMPDAIRFAFEVLSKDGIAEGAELEITMIPIKAHCLDCGETHVMEEYKPFCPACDSAALNIIEGRAEMRVASMEVDDR